VALGMMYFKMPCVYWKVLEYYSFEAFSIFGASVWRALSAHVQGTKDFDYFSTACNQILSC
jgi:hypothetical protein